MEKEIYKLAGILIPVFRPKRMTVNHNRVLFVFIMSGWAFVWKSSKQDIIEAEYMRVSNMVLEMVLDQRSSLDELEWSLALLI